MNMNLVNLKHWEWWSGRNQICCIVLNFRRHEKPNFVVVLSPRPPRHNNFPMDINMMIPTFCTQEKILHHWNYERENWIADRSAGWSSSESCNKWKKIFWMSKARKGQSSWIWFNFPVLSWFELSDALLIAWMFLFLNYRCHLPRVCAQTFEVRLELHKSCRKTLSKFDVHSVTCVVAVDVKE